MQNLCITLLIELGNNPSLAVTVDIVSLLHIHSESDLL